MCEPVFIPIFIVEILFWTLIILLWTLLPVNHLETCHKCDDPFQLQQVNSIDSCCIRNIDNYNCTDTIDYICMQPDMVIVIILTIFTVCLGFFACCCFLYGCCNCMDETDKYLKKDRKYLKKLKELKEINANITNNEIITAEIITAEIINESHKELEIP